ncbi:hypothetical protein AB0C33_38295 [Nonomuraea sp. NPDC048881]
MPLRPDPVTGAAPGHRLERLVRDQRRVRLRRGRGSLAARGRFGFHAGGRADDLQGTACVAELLRPARPVLLDLADRAHLREAARAWGQRVDVHTARTDRRPSDALLIRPDAHVAWAASVDEPADTAVPALHEALSLWFGTP